MELIKKFNFNNYKDINQTGLVNSYTEIKLHPNFGRCISLENINKYFFGYLENLSNICNFDLITKNITVKINEKIFIKLSMLSEYFDYVNKIVDFNSDKSYLPFNYFLVTSSIYNKSMPIFYKKIFNFFEGFCNYLDKEVNTIESKNIKKMIFNEKGYFIGYLNSPIIKNPYTVVINFDSYNNYFSIVVGNELDSILENFVSFSDFDSHNINNIYEKIFKSIAKKILLQRPEDYIINNLTNITKNRSLAELIFKSYDKQCSYVIDVREIESIIMFKNNKAKIDYRNDFRNIYIESNIFLTNKNGLNYSLNFEGFNKYLLNLSPVYLSTFKMKEMINDLYYRITKELIDSYNQLFRNFKF